MNILILAAGYATRLYPLTLNTPKPLLKVGGRPIIERIFAKAAAADGVKKCYIVTNRKFFGSFRDWAAAFRFSAPVEAVDDGTTTNENRLGAIRDIEFVIKKYDIEDDLLVIGGDNLFEFSLGAFVDFARDKYPYASLALFDIGDIEKAKIYGVAKIDSTARVIDFKEKPAQPDSTLIATCVYYFPKERLGLVSDYIASGQKQDAPGNYIKWLSETDRVYGFVFKENWYDIGDLESYEEADRKYSG